MPSFRFFHMKMLKIKNDRNRESDKGETAVSANLPRSVILGPARLPQGTAAPWSEMFGMLFGLNCANCLNLWNKIYNRF